MTKDICARCGEGVVTIGVGAIIVKSYRPYGKYPRYLNEKGLTPKLGRVFRFDNTELQ